MSQHAYRRASNEELTELRRQLNEKVQLLEFGRQIALASADLDEVLDRLAREVIETGLFDVLMIALVDVKADRVVPVRSWMRDENEGSDHASVSALSELTSPPPLLAEFGARGRAPDHRELGWTPARCGAWPRSRRGRSGGVFRSGEAGRSRAGAAWHHQQGR